jgi:hypothetical protein
LKPNAQKTAQKIKIQKRILDFHWIAELSTNQHIAAALLLPTSKAIGD